MHRVRFADVDWHAPTLSREEVAAATELPEPPLTEPGRKFLVEGESGFFVQTVRLPPGFEAPAHHHSHPEVFLVLDGDCVFNGKPLGRYDAVVVEADEHYGFTAGADGVQFLVTRTAPATFTEAAGENTP